MVCAWPGVCLLFGCPLHSHLCESNRTANRSLVLLCKIFLKALNIVQIHNLEFYQNNMLFYKLCTLFFLILGNVFVGRCICC